MKKLVFCYQNCSDLLWEKIVLVIEKIFKIFEIRLIKNITIQKFTYSNNELKIVYKIDPGILLVN